MTQAEQIVNALRASRRGMTYLEMEALKVSACPWKRLSEAGHRYLRKGEQIVRRTGRDGLVRVCVVRGGGR